MKLSRFAGYALAAALLAVPAVAQSTASQSAPQAQAPAQSMSVSGTVVSVTDTALTLNTSSNSGSAQESNSTATEVKFVIDSNTKIDGTPTAGAKATVEYTTDSNNRRVATHITIQS